MPNELYIYDGFITDGSGTITGSFNVSGSTTQIGNNTLLGNTTLTGSVTISGSVPPGSTSPSIQIYGDIRQTGYHRFDPVTTNINTSISASYIYVSSSTNDLYFSQNSAGYANATRLRWIEGNLYSGLLHGGIITQSGSTAYRVSSGSGIIVSINASYNDDPYPTVQFLEWPTLTGTITALSSSYDQQFIAISSSAGTPVIVAQGTPYNDGDYNTSIPIGIVIHQNRSSINAVQTFPSTAYGWKQRSYDFVKAFGPLKISGYTLSVSGSSTGSLLLSGGTAFVEGRNYIVDPNNPSYIVEANGITTSKIFRYYQSGSNWQSTWGYDTNGGTGYTAIDPTKYSNAGTLTSVGSNKWSIQRVYYFPNSATKAFYIYYGNAQYDNKLDALAALTTETFTEAPNTLANAIFVGYMVLRDDANFNTAASYEFRAAGMFRGSSAGGGSTGGATALTSLTDVSVATPADGDLLRYNSVISKWTNTKILTGSYTLSGSLSVNGSLTGSLFGTATSSSYAISAVTASYITANQPSSGSTYSILLTDSSNPGLVYRSASLQYDPAANVILTTVASSSNSVFGAYNETVPLETGYAIVVTPYGEAGQLEAPNTLKFDPFANSLTVTASYAYTASFATTASYILNAVSSSFATRAVTASYVLNAVSASFASTASFVNTLNQNVLITGSLTIGTSSIGANENTLILGPSPAGGTGEGGQILLQAPGGTYTSASMFDNYQNSTRLLRGTNAGSDAIVAQWNMHTKQMSLPAYNSTSAFSGTVVGLLAFDSSGNILTTTASTGGGGGGSGTVNSGVAGYLAYYPSTGTTVDDTSGVFWDAGNSRLIVTGSVIASANNSMYFRGGDDAELWDINVANTVGIYGQQDQGVASVKLGSGGGTISGRSGSIGIGTITPNSGSLHVAGNVFANSFTGSFLGTASYALDGGVPYVASTGLTSTTGVPPEEGGPAPVNFSVNLSTGISGGQSVIGGTGLAENLTLSSTTNAGKGSIRFGSSSYLESSDYLGINQLIPTSRLHINTNQTGSIQSDANGILLANSTAATANTQSISPGIVFQGNGWKTATTASSQDVRFRIDVLPVQGSATASANLQIASNINSAGYRTGFTLSSAGDISILSGSLNVAQNITGSRMYLSSSNGTATGSTLIVYGSGSAQPVFTVQGSQGQLFSVTDSLSGSLFSVNDISGLPILRVLSDSTTLIGNYPTLMLTTTARVVQTSAGSFVVYSLPTGSYNTAFFEYSAQSGSNARAGTIVAFQSGSSVNYTETTTTDFGSTSTISFGVFVTGSNFALTGSCSTANWTIKTIIRGI